MSDWMLGHLYFLVLFIYAAAEDSPLEETVASQGQAPGMSLHMYAF
jgi:hypothetical protein